MQSGVALLHSARELQHQIAQSEGRSQTAGVAQELLLGWIGANGKQEVDSLDSGNNKNPDSKALSQFRF